MRTSKEEWDKIYETACKIAEKYGILNLPVNENYIFVYYNSKKIFDTEQDFENRKKIVYEIEKTFEKEKISGEIDIKISDDLDKRIIIERK